MVGVAKLRLFEPLTAAPWLYVTHRCCSHIGVVLSFVDVMSRQKKTVSINILYAFNATPKLNGRVMTKKKLFILLLGEKKSHFLCCDSFKTKFCDMRLEHEVSLVTPVKW